MNTLKGLVLALCVAFAVCETCIHTDNCHDTTCTAGTKKCVEVAGQHLCTCVHLNTANPSCTTADDCSTINCAQQHGPHSHNYHCVDNHCACEGLGHNHQGHQQPAPGEHLPPSTDQHQTGQQHHNNAPQQHHQN
ncbi:uncharacterized protein [Argopecten irradians]|uniref:uncharacterized protein isoform X3 n=1 Tax=Argopecten irradians TaxID=31199 RepID=UPI0037178A14